jgi:hypothetical protein
MAPPTYPAAADIRLWPPVAPAWTRYCTAPVQRPRPVPGRRTSPPQPTQPQEFTATWGPQHSRLKPSSAVPSSPTPGAPSLSCQRQGGASVAFGIMHGALTSFAPFWRSAPHGQIQVGAMPLAQPAHASKNPSKQLRTNGRRSARRNSEESRPAFPLANLISTVPSTISFPCPWHLCSIIRGHWGAPSQDRPRRRFPWFCLPPRRSCRHVVPPVLGPILELRY